MLNLLEQKPPLPLRLVSLFFALCSLLFSLFAFTLVFYALRCSVLIELNERNNSMNATNAMNAITL
jgi:hypothetical protein